MYTLGIETSCDETAAAVTDGKKILSNIVTSSVHLHSKYGGVVPEIASRFHLEYINSVIRDSLAAARVALKEIKLIAVTEEPGLIGSLLVGLSMARSLSYSLSVPMAPVNHVIAHLYANIMRHAGIKFPFIGLVVSGGHTSIIMMRDIDKWESIGQTQDDAAGEAFDKVAKILGLGYPGGPIIEKRARYGDPKAIKFPRSSLKKGIYDFSFSGIKTAVLYYVNNQRGHPAAQMTRVSGSTFVQQSVPEVVNNICAAFQEAACDMITQKTILACRDKRLDTLVAGGGVIANSRLRASLEEEAAKWGINVYFPPIDLCLDNGAMVAGLGEALYKKGHPRASRATP